MRQQRVKNRVIAAGARSHNAVRRMKAVLDLINVLSVQFYLRPIADFPPRYIAAVQLLINWTPEALVFSLGVVLNLLLSVTESAAEA